MVASASERIVVDDDVFRAQVRTLEEHADTLQSAVRPAQQQLSGTAFGVLNGFLVVPINHCATRTAEVAQEATELAARMAAGVRAARTAFSDHDADAAANFDRREVGQ